MYRSGLASVINSISQPFPAYVSPRRLNNKLGCKRRANERLFAKFRIYERDTFQQAELHLEEGGHY